MDERMTLCNMSIEGGARVGYVNPDEITFAYLKGRPYAPKDKDWERAVAYWKSIASDADAVYDDVVHYRAEDIAPSLTWGVNPGQVITIDEPVPAPEQFPENERPGIADALKYMQLSARRAHQGHQGRRHLHRQLHQQSPERSARGREVREGQAGRRPA